MSEERVKTYCGNCAKETYQGIEYRNEEVEALEILAKDDEKHKTESMWIPGFAFWQVSKCLGCEKLTFKHVLKTSHDPAMDIVSYFPKYHLRPVPEWYRELPIRYLEILKEVYTSIHHGSFILSLMGLRTVLDVFIIEKIGDQGTFQQKLNVLVNKGIITRSKANTLKAAIDAGNAAAHRGYKPDQKILFKIADIVDNLLHSEIVDRNVDIINGSTPKR